MIDSVHINDSTIYGPSWADPELRPLFTEQNKIKGWLEVMTVLAEVQAEFGLIPAQAATEIRRAYENIDIDEAFLQEAAEGFAKTNHSLVGLINAFKQRYGAAGGEWLCYGATVQDITDIHTVRTLLKVHEHFLAQIIEIERILIDLARLHRQTVMCGRTHAQPGLLITFGFKAATWLDELERHRQRLTELKSRLNVGQLCGGVGSLSSLGPDALALQLTVLQRLGLNAPAISWTSTRDRYAEWVNLLAMMTATGDRIGQEVVNLQRPEIGELSEGFVSGAVGSITMPQKRNPEISEHLGTLSRVVRHHAAHMAENLVHSHERDGRSWKGEWIIIPDATLATGKSLALLKLLLKDLQINPQRMLANIQTTQGFVHAEAVMLALAKALGKQSAHRLVYDLAMQAQSEELHLKQALLNNPQIGAILRHDEIEALFNPEHSTGVCETMVEQVVARISLP
ncbi:class-II fumarase/aspartase family protein [Candidatus Methylobacter oryzae]|uniref:Adenylosuccinate lyase family protein n=1 Tax=Candidatus Methylobacter oryzae TaxID=2497749 RepID=A0ABY3CFU2_9GAMM|nr:adenylosuccinate lyase family protein [Candidatus Methylobacter oryzae]TRX02623.1 adenylosuccinate lyase family protein [Candidatus Methylobacter oryzae]